MKTRSAPTSRELAKVAVFVLFCAAGCGASCVTRGADLYADGNYVAAAEFFEHTEARLNRASPQERARYALYRGATLLSLGEYDAADHWLNVAWREKQSRPSALDRAESAMLAQALEVQTRVVIARNAKLERNLRQASNAGISASELPSLR